VQREEEAFAVSGACQTSLGRGFLNGRVFGQKVFKTICQRQLKRAKSLHGDERAVPVVEKRQRHLGLKQRVDDGDHLGPGQPWTISMAILLTQAGRLFDLKAHDILFH
jgi:hypothetical protein